MRALISIVAATALVAATEAAPAAALQTNPIYSSGMVLQRFKPIPVSGKASPNAEVTVTLGGSRVATTVAPDGTWRVVLPAMQEATDLKMTVVSDGDTIIYDNVAIGEVWLASGQSNMEFKMRATTTFAADSALLADDDLRLYNMLPRALTNAREWSEENKAATDSMEYYLPTSWQASTRQTAAPFSAVAWYFGRELRDSLQVPVGIICNAIGGSGTEAWISREAFDRKLPGVPRDWRTNSYLMPWVQERALQNTGTPDHHHPYEPSYLYATGIEPLNDFPVAGVIWYQGESNAHDVGLHESMFRILVDDWRRARNDEHLPFIFAQLSSHDRPTWPEFRDSQRRMAADLEDVYMAVTTDVGDSLDVHPRNKRPVGQRLSRQALNHVYGRADMTPSGPLPARASIIGDNAVAILFEYGEGLSTSDGDAPKTFEIEDIDGNVIACEATIADNSIVLAIPAGTTPMAVRYGWQPFTRANVVNGDGLPASTFRLPLTTANESSIEYGLSGCSAGRLDGKIISVGGCNFPSLALAPQSTKKYYSGIYNITVDNGTSVYTLIGEMPHGMAYAATTVTPRGLAVIGGMTETGALSTAWLVDAEGAVTELPSMPCTVYDATAACIDGKVYVAGGYIDGKPSNRLIMLDLNDTSRGWQVLPAFPGNARVQPVMAAAEVTGKPRLYMWGGFAPGSEPTLETAGYAYDITKKKWSRLAAPVSTEGEEISTGGGCALALPDGSILVAGGVNKDVFLEALRNPQPDYLAHPTAWYQFNPYILRYYPAEGVWQVVATDRLAARAGASLVDGPTMLGGEIRPRIRTTIPLEIKL